ncbi:MAG: TIGR00341 family protein [Candidatus Berkiella sp.]
MTTIRTVQIITPKEHYKKVSKQIQESEVIDSWDVIDNSKENIIFSVLVSLDDSEKLIDKLRSNIDNKIIKKIIISNIETIIPKEVLKLNPSRFKIVDESERASREELYNQLDNETNLNTNYILLALLSTLVAGLGLLENHIPAVIAAMVIAPMLMPNLAMALAAVLGDKRLLIKSFKTNAVGIICCFILSIIIGFFWQFKVDSAQLLLRTNVSYTDISLALASGAAAALSVVSRLSAALVGVMVAVTLLPPIVACGILLGAGVYTESLWAGLLFVVNIVSINLVANLVFIFQGVRPQKWYEKKKAKKAIFWYLVFWITSLLILISVVYIHQSNK